MTIRSYIAGCGSYLPIKCLSNAELARNVDTSDEWIQSRTGIRERRIAADNQFTSDLGHAAAINALQNANIDVKDVDLIILATTTPDQTFPATATRIQSMLNMKHGAAFDVQAVCSGFIYALSIADNFIRAKQAENILVIGAETFSRLLDWNDRSTCILFGDGAGAVLVSKGAEFSNISASNQRGILSTHIHSDGDFSDLLYVDGGPSSTKTVGQVRMTGKEVFRHATINLAAVVDEALKANNLELMDIDWLVPHQANKRILESTAKKLRLDHHKIIVTLERHANTSAASIPLALDEAVKDGRIKTGQLILLEAMGGGFTWGASLVRW